MAFGPPPLRVVFTAEITGGANDHEDFYCAKIEWEWGDGSTSSFAYDCDPYEPGKSEIRRRFIADHTYNNPGRVDVVFRLKPMNCPSHMTLFREMGRHSYRELPLRFAEFATLYRYEKTGELTGLTRVRALTQDDCHTFCTEDQIGSEFTRSLHLIQEVLGRYRFTGLDPGTYFVVVHEQNFQPGQPLYGMISSPGIWNIRSRR